MYGELIPEGGGDPIPLLKEKLVCGRRESCDIVLRFSNISTEHCELEMQKGYWFVNDLNSRNGTRVNGFRVNRKRLDPGDNLSIARHDYKINYSPKDLGAVGPPPDEDIYEEILSRSLLEGAGLSRQQRQKLQGRIGRGETPQPAGKPGTPPPGPMDQGPMDQGPMDQGPMDQPADEPAANAGQPIEEHPDSDDAQTDEPTST